MGTSLAQNLSNRDHSIWLPRGLRLFFIFGVACLMTAIVTFVAHNLTYLSTVGKLGGIGVFLLVAVAAWIRLGINKTLGAVASGMTAQLLIGVWLAAAGQLYQAPGGLQDLLIVWLVLGLPFALASRHASHWAMWLALVFGISVTKNGTYFYEYLGFMNQKYKILIWAIIFSGLTALTLWRKAPIWLMTSLSLIASGFLIPSIFVGVDSLKYFWFFIVAGLIAIGFAYFLYKQKKALGALCIFTLVVLSLPVSLLIRLISEIDSGWGYINFLLTAIVFGAATFAMIRLFKQYRTHFDDKSNVHIEAAQGANLTAEAENASPWYMDVLIAIGGILTAIFATAFIGSLLGVLLAVTRSQELGMLIIGLALYGIFFTLYFRQSSSDKDRIYLNYLFGTLLLVGQITALIGFALVTDSFSSSQWLGSFSILLATPILLVIRRRVMEVIQALIISGSIFVAIYWDFTFGYKWAEPILFVSLIGFAALCFFIRFKGYWRNAAALIFLLAAICAGLINPDFLFETQGLLQGGLDSLWPILSRGLLFTCAVLGIWFSRLISTLPSLPILIAITVIVAILPGGAAGAALILLIGYAAGLRSYFVVGSVASLYFLFAAYYDLRLTLMELSGVLALSGIIFLGMWYISRRKLGDRKVSQEITS